MNSVKRRLSATALLFLGQEKASSIDLYLAAWTGSAKIISLRDGAEVDITSPDASGTTAIHLAVWNMHNNVKYPTRRRTRDIADYVSTQNEDLYSALHLAAWNDDGKMITRLLEAGAEISAKDKNGLTPLHWAARLGNNQAIHVLIRSGADVDIRDKQGWQPIQLAEIHGQNVAMSSILSQTQIKRIELANMERTRNARAPVAPGWPGPPPPARTIERLPAPARPPSRDNISANSHAGEPPKNGLQKVRVTGKAL
jgi:ankyrin repeat protein